MFHQQLRLIRNTLQESHQESSEQQKVCRELCSQSGGIRTTLQIRKPWNAPKATRESQGRKALGIHRPCLVYVRAQLGSFFSSALDQQGCECCPRATRRVFSEYFGSDLERGKSRVRTRANIRQRRSKELRLGTATGNERPGSGRLLD